MTTAVLEEVEWFKVDHWDKTGESLCYRDCDICFEDATEDACAGKAPEEFRKFWRDHAEGLDVCEHCIEAYLREAP